MFIKKFAQFIKSKLYLNLDALGLKWLENKQESRELNKNFSHDNSIQGYLMMTNR